MSTPPAAPTYFVAVANSLQRQFTDVNAKLADIQVKLIDKKRIRIALKQELVSIKQETCEELQMENDRLARLIQFPHDVSRFHPDAAPLREQDAADAQASRGMSPPANGPGGVQDSLEAVWRLVDDRGDVEDDALLAHLESTLDEEERIGVKLLEQVLALAAQLTRQHEQLTHQEHEARRARCIQFCNDLYAAPLGEDDRRTASLAADDRGLIQDSRDATTQDGDDPDDVQDSLEAVWRLEPTS